MNESKKRILDMLAEGKITSDEATLLLDQLDEPTAVPPPPPPPMEPMAYNAPIVSEKKLLRVIVNVQNEQDRPINVHINLPLKAARIAGDIITRMLPEEARDTLEDEGIDLSAMNIGELIDALEETGGDIVNISHEGEEERVVVRIYVE